MSPRKRKTRSRNFPVAGMTDIRRWEVELIRGHTYVKKTLFYFVKWKGFPLQDTWEPWYNLEGTHNVLQDYHKIIDHEPPKRSEDEICSGCNLFTHVTNSV